MRRRCTGEGNERVPWQAAFGACLLVLAAGCQSSPKASLPSPPPVLRVRMNEYALANAPSIRAGRVVLEAGNVGRLRHRLLLVPLPEDYPPILEQVRGAERRPVDPLAAVPLTAPGQSRQTAVDLAPGRYGLFCPIVSAEGRSHAVEGMASEVRVR